MNEGEGSAQAGGLDRFMQAAHALRLRLLPAARWFREYFPVIAFLVGIFAGVYFWVAVSYDGYLNSSWWSFTQSSFSALGDPDATDARGLAWIYSDAIMIPTGIMMMVFGGGMVIAARNKLQTAGSVFFVVAGVFLSLIGVYHGGYGDGTLHDFISTWFFAWAAVGILAWGFGLLWERRWRLGVAMTVLVIGGVIIADLAVHPFHWSVGETEAYGILIIDVYIFLMFFGRKALPKP